MTLDELEGLCLDAIEAGRDVQLVVSRTPAGSRVRLFGRRGPLCKQIACVSASGTVAWWDPAVVLAYLRKHAPGEVDPK